MAKDSYKSLIDHIELCGNIVDIRFMIELFDGSSLTGAADHYRKRQLLIGVVGGTASGKVGDLYIVPGANRVRIDQIFPSVRSL